MNPPILVGDRGLKTPKISGFTIIRHGCKFDYPFMESLRSLVPLVDEIVINVGIGDDETLAKIREFSAGPGQNKVKWFESLWPLDDPEKRRGGKILSEQTNLALDRCENDWCIYLQADEVLHHEEISDLRRTIAWSDPHPEVEGILFDYLHFYGSYDVIQVSRSAYRREVRAVRKSSGARSVGDAQSFRKPDGSKLTVVHSDTSIYHYGWVRTPDAMKAKTFFMDSLYHGAPDPKLLPESKTATGDNYRYKKIWGLQRFTGHHPSAMIERIRAKNWNWDLENSPLEWSLRDAKKVALDLIERATGKRIFEYRSYRELG